MSAEHIGACIDVTCGVRWAQRCWKPKLMLSEVKASSLNVLAGSLSWASHWTQARAARNKSISSPEPQPNGQFVHRKWGESLWVNYLSQIIRPALPDRAAFCVWSLWATVAGIKGSFVRGLSAEDVVENYIKDKKSRVWPKVPNPSTTSELLSWSFDRRREKKKSNCFWGCLKRGCY